jgi:hypothetical protein
MEQQSIEIKYLLKIMKSKRTTRTWASSQQQWTSRGSVHGVLRAGGACSHTGSHGGRPIKAIRLQHAAAVIQEFHTHVAQRQEDECSKLPLYG